MTPIPHSTKSYKSNQDGRFYGTLSYGGAVVAAVVEGTDVGFKNADSFDAWARQQAIAHKTSITAAPVHVVTKEFTV